MSQLQLERARSVERPSREAMLQRAPSVQNFWLQNRDLFKAAWEEWDVSANVEQFTLDETLYDPKLRAAIAAAWADPATENAVADLWEEVMPGVLKTQFFDPDQLARLRDYLKAVADSQIPLRPPYGLVLNRGGAMLDPRSEGYLASPHFQAFYRDLMDTYMRPIARLLFPETTGYDTQTFGFSIQWQASKDTSLRPHSDASAVTLNINLNLPGEDFSGSAVSFFDANTRERKDLTFEPGVAVIHRGHLPHASQPITQGERSNFVLWLYGEGGQVPGDVAGERIDAQQRWAVPKGSSDNFAPF